MTTIPSEPQTPRTEPRTGRRWGDIAVASLLSATLATGGTYAVVRGADGAGDDPAATSQTSAAPAADTAESSGGTNGTPTSFTPAQDWAQIATSVSASVVSIEVAGQAGQGAGSGVVWDAEGHIITNAHVVEGAQAVQVVLSDGRRYDAEVSGADPSSDLAVLALASPPDDLAPITVGDDTVLSVGEPVMAIGNPLGLSGTVTTGIVSALDRPVTTLAADSQNPSASTQVVTNAIQTSAAINPGNSGGALVNAAGELVGINSSIASIPSPGQSQAGSIGIGFAIPSSKVQLIADQLIEDGTAEHAFLGVGLGDGSGEADEAIRTGAQVRQVEPGSPAAEAGLQEGDLIVGIDGEQVPSALALVGQVRERGSGQEAELEYIRDGQLQTVAVTLATRPDERP